MKNNRRQLNEEAERRMKRQRRRKRSRSEPLLDTESSEKREALKRLFGKICSVEAESQRIHEDNNEYESFPDESSDFPDDNGDFPDVDSGFLESDDPLLDSVPVDMDPEQLGFLVCAQETLRFLHGRGVPVEHPVFTRLRMRLLRGIDEMAVA